VKYFTDLKAAEMDEDDSIPSQPPRRFLGRVRRSIFAAPDKFAANESRQPPRSTDECLDELKQEGSTVFEVPYVFCVLTLTDFFCISLEM